MGSLAPTDHKAQATFNANLSNIPLGTEGPLRQQGLATCCIELQRQRFTLRSIIATRQLDNQSTNPLPQTPRRPDGIDYVSLVPTLHQTSPITGKQEHTDNPAVETFIGQHTQHPWMTTPR